MPDKMMRTPSCRVLINCDYRTTGDGLREGLSISRSCIHRRKAQYRKRKVLCKFGAAMQVVRTPFSPTSRISDRAKSLLHSVVSFPIQFKTYCVHKGTREGIRSCDEMTLRFLSGDCRLVVCASVDQLPNAPDAFFHHTPVLQCSSITTKVGSHIRQIYLSEGKTILASSRRRNALSSAPCSSQK